MQFGLAVLASGEFHLALWGLWSLSFSWHHSRGRVALAVVSWSSQCLPLAAFFFCIWRAGALAAFLWCWHAGALLTHPTVLPALPFLVRHLPDDAKLVAVQRHHFPVATPQNEEVDICQHPSPSSMSPSFPCPLLARVCQNRRIAEPLMRRWKIYTTLTIFRAWFVCPRSRRDSKETKKSEGVRKALCVIPSNLKASSCRGGEHGDCPPR